LCKAIKTPLSRTVMAALLSSMSVLVLAGCGHGDTKENVEAKGKPASGPKIIPITEDTIKRIDFKTEVVEERDVAVPLHLTGKI
jgi:hypothetical protein